MTRSSPRRADSIPFTFSITATAGLSAAKVLTYSKYSDCRLSFAGS